MIGGKIKILLIQSLNFFEQDSANANRWRTLVEGLANTGVEIEIIFTQGYTSFSELRKYGRKSGIGKISFSYTIFLLQNSLWARRISGYVLSPLLKKYNASLIKKKINAMNPHIVWLQPSIEIFDIYLIAERKLKQLNYNLMIELNEYNDIGLVHSTNKLQFDISKRYSKVLLKKILPKTDLLLIMTRHLLEYYRQFTDCDRARFLHLPMTVDMERFNLNRKSNVRYIAYCGSSSFVKDGVDILIKSFSMITNTFPDVKLKIAAFMESDGGKMLDLIKELDLSVKVEYVGELKRDEIPDFIINAELLLLPRPDSKQTRGGFPTKLGEYLATGNPVCVTTVGEIPDYLTDNISAFMAQPGSVDSFADAMQRALSNQELAKKVGINGRRVAEQNFSMDVQTKRLYSFLSEKLIKRERFEKSF